MCMSMPDPPEPEDPSLQENELLIDEGEEDRRISRSKRRGTQGLQIALNTGNQGGSGLTI